MYSASAGLYSDIADIVDTSSRPFRRRPSRTLWNRYGANRSTRWNLWPWEISVTVGADLVLTMNEMQHARRPRQAIRIRVRVSL